MSDRAVFVDLDDLADAVAALERLEAPGPRNGFRFELTPHAQPLDPAEVRLLDRLRTTLRKAGR
jgi:hypothetical protein